MLIITEVYCNLRLGILLKKFGRFEDALFELNEAIYLDPNFANQYYERGIYKHSSFLALIFVELNRLDKAK